MAAGGVRGNGDSELLTKPGKAGSSTMLPAGPRPCLPGHPKLLRLPSRPTDTEKDAPLSDIVSIEGDRQFVPPTLKEQERE